MELTAARKFVAILGHIKQQTNLLVEQAFDACVAACAPAQDSVYACTGVLQTYRAVSVQAIVECMERCDVAFVHVLHLHQLCTATCGGYQDILSLGCS